MTQDISTIPKEKPNLPIAPLRWPNLSVNACNEDPHPPFALPVPSYEMVEMYSVPRPLKQGEPPTLGSSAAPGGAEDQLRAT